MEPGARLFEPLLVLSHKRRLDEAGQLQKGADLRGLVMIGMALWFQSMALWFD